jgi:hypothetical protein
MRSTFYITASALLALVSAQTFTDCDPTKKTCPNNPAMPATFETNFKAGKDAVKGWKQTAGTLNYVSSGAEFTVSKKGEAPTIQSDGYLHFGKIEVTMKAAPGAGIVSSIVLQSDDLDEVDWEFIGSVSGKAQMNYFGKGNTTTYDRMIEANVNNVQEMHTYALDWTKDAITWIIDGQPMRTLKYSDANGGKNFPQTPSNVRIGIWAGGDSVDQGTRDWAGGAPDYSKAPFTQLVESVKITNYSPGKEYQWTDMSGSYQSIKVIEPGNTEGAPTNSALISASGTGAAPTAPLASGVKSDTSLVLKPTGSDTSLVLNPTATGTSGSNYGNGAVPANGEAPANGGKEDCGGCSGTLTVTVTGDAPPATSVPTVPATAPATSVPAPTVPAPTAPAPTVPAPTVPVPTAPAVSAPVVPAPPPAQSTSTSCTESTLATQPIKSTAPAVSGPATTAPPYPIISTGIKTDSRPIPTGTGGVAKPTGGNMTFTPPQVETNGAGVNGVATALFGVVGAVMAMAAL